MKALRRFTVLAAALVGALLLPATIAAAETPVHTVVVTAEGIEVPEDISAGIVVLNVDNTARTEAPAMIVLARLNDDQTPESFSEAIAAGDPNVLFSITESPDSTIVLPGDAIDMVFEMSARTYVIADFAREVPAIAFFEVADPESPVELVDCLCYGV